MPKFYKKKAPYRKRTKKYAKKGTYFKRQKGLSRSVIPFTREKETYFHLHDLTGNGITPFSNFVHTGDGGVVGRISLMLNQLPAFDDFTNLFRQYKLTGIKIIFYPASNTTVAGGTRDAAGPNSNNGVLIRVMKNYTGIAMAAGNTISEWSQIQAKKQWILSQTHPTSIYCPLRQMTDVRSGNDMSSNEQVVSRPKWISTNDPNVIHQGLNIRFDSLNGEPLEDEARIWPEFRIVAKYYFMCKGVA